MSTVKKYFNKKCESVFVNADLKDYSTYRYIKAELIEDVKNKFNIAEEEEILFIRDTSFWNKRNQGTVITDKKIYCIPDNEKSADRIEIAWETIECVKYKNTKLCFSGNWGLENELAVDIKNFLKRLSEKELFGYKIAEFFTEISQLVKDNESKYLDAYKMFFESDGKISDRERYTLDLLRDKLGISEERADDLEKTIEFKTMSRLKSLYKQLRLLPLIVSVVLNKCFNLLIKGLF